MKSTDEVDAHIGARVRMQRMMLGMSQEQLGKSLGLTFQQIQKYEKGLNRIGAGRLYRIASILSVPVEFFYEGLPNLDFDGTPGGTLQRGSDIQEFLSTPDGLALSSSFVRIRDTATRRRLLDLVNTIAQLGDA